MHDDPRIGTEVGGYRIERLLGRGGMGVVYAAEHLHLQRLVAFKVLAPEIANSPGFRERFLRESRLAASIQHPHIVTVYDAGEVDGLLWISMQFVEGETLADLLAREGGLEPARALALLGQVAGALDVAHGRGLVHRDVKPANVLLGRERAYLTDFGLTRRTDASTAFTKTGQFVGTLDYVAPEQISGSEVDGRTDVYALGCVLYQCLTGETPYPRDSEVAVIYAHLESPAPKPSAARAGLPPALDPVIERALAKRKEERGESCAALIAAAESAAGGSAPATPARPSPPTRATAPSAAPAPTAPAARPPAVAPPPPTTYGRRSRLPLLVGAALLAALAVVAVVALGGGGDDGGSGGDGPREPQIESFRAGERPFGVAVGGGSVLVANQSGDTITRLALDGSGRTNVTAGSGPFWVAEGRDAFWVTNSLDNTVTRLSRDDLSSEATIPVGESPYWVAVDDGVVWVVNGSSDTVTRLGEDSGRPLGEPIAVGESPRGIALARGSAWVVNSADDSVSRIDAGSGTVTGDPIGVGRDPNAIAYGNDTLWVTCEGDDSVVRIDPESGETAGEPIEVGREPFDVAHGEGAVWVTNGADDTVTRLDPDSGEPEGDPIEMKGQPVGVTVGGGYVWVTLNDAGQVRRIEP